MEFTEFLINAKLSGYATGGEGKEIKLEDGGSKFYHTEQDFEYSDIYYGFNPFIGQEVVKRNGITIWLMNYYGETNCANIKASSIYQFLKLALQNLDPELPLRGPSEFKRDSFDYINTVNGNIDLFSGEEIIHYDQNQVYKLCYHGCTIKSV